MPKTLLKEKQLDLSLLGAINILNNGDFRNNSSNGYGNVPDNWINSNANPFQGGFPSLTAQEIADALGISVSSIKGKWDLNGNFNDSSGNGYNLTANGTPTDSNNSLMALSKAFNGSTQYANIDLATATALNINTAQSWVIFIYPSAVSSAYTMAMSGTSGAERGIYLTTTTGKVQFYFSGLTPDSIVSDVYLEAGKLNMIVGVYDPGVGEYRLYVNGVEKGLAVSGTMTALSNTPHFAIGRKGNVNGSYYSGSAQMSMFLNTALTSVQVRKLWYLTSYRKMKIRRSGTDGYLYQQLSDNEVVALRGRSLSAVANAYKESSGMDVSISIVDDAGETSASVSAAGAYETLYVNRTISSTATFVHIRLNVKTTNGNAWFNSVMAYTGSAYLRYRHSEKDYVRFPRLLNMDIPQFADAYPYQYEENRWFSGRAPTVTPGGSLTVGTVTTEYAKFLIRGKSCIFRSRQNATMGGTGNPILTITSPVNAAGANGTEGNKASFFISSWLAGNGYHTTPLLIQLNKYDNSNHPNSGGYYWAYAGEFEIN